MLGMISGMFIFSIGLFYSEDIDKALKDRKDKKRGWKWNEELNCYDIIEP